MRELRNILELYDRGHAVVLVTLVRVEGSSYRRAGARLLIAQNGEYAGGISGGCLEAEVIRKAQWKISNGPIVDRYSTLFDDTADIPYGLGCGGTVDLLLEPTDTPECIALMQAIRATLHGQPHTLATTLPTATSPLLRTITMLDAQLKTEDPSPQPGIFYETLTPPQRLLIFGAGDDAQPMVRMAAFLGWNILVLDGRPQWARPGRFPEAAQVLVADAANFAAAQTTGSGSSPAPEALSVTPQDAVIIMTHSYEQDRAYLTAVLPRHPRYLGLLGARHRTALLISEAAATLHWPLAAACEGLFAPIGLDLGGDGAEIIALATIAEIQASLENKIGSPRRMTPEIIASQLDEASNARYLQTQCAL